MKAIVVTFLLALASPAMAANPAEAAGQGQDEVTGVPVQAWRACVIDAAIRASRVQGMPSPNAAVDAADKLCWASRRPVREALPVTVRKVMAAQGIKHYGADLEDELIAETIDDMAAEIRGLALAIISSPEVVAQYRR